MGGGLCHEIWTLTGTISIRNPLRDSLSFPSGGRSGRPRTAGHRSGFGRSAGGTQPDLRDSGIHFTNRVLMNSSKRDRRYKKMRRLEKELQIRRSYRIRERPLGINKDDLTRIPYNLFIPSVSYFRFHFSFPINYFRFVFCLSQIHSIHSSNPAKSILPCVS